MYFKSVLVGIGTAVAAVLMWIIATLVVPIAAPFLISRFTGDGGAGGAGAMVSSGSILLVAIAGFVAGFYWQLRKSPAPDRKPNR